MRLARTDARLVAAQDLERLILAARYPVLPPAARAAAFAVLDEQVRGVDAAAVVAGGGSRSRAGGAVDAGGGVEGGHVLLELVNIGALGRLPARLLGLRVEVVGQIL